MAIELTTIVKIAINHNDQERCAWLYACAPRISCESGWSICERLRAEPIRRTNTNPAYHASGVADLHVLALVNYSPPLRLLICEPQPRNELEPSPAHGP
jgi:hypothetical protein